MSGWRLLKLETGDAFTNMAIDEAILTSRIAGKVPNTLRFYRWSPSAVSIGRFQGFSDEVHVENCRKRGVDIVRRITGGGAVYHDHGGEITYSVVVDGKDLDCTDLNIMSAYKRICEGLIEGVGILGSTAELNLHDPKQCPNVTVEGKKISGSAQSYRRGVLLQHGTLLLDIDHERMFTFLRVPWAKTLMDVVKVSKRRLTSAKQEIESQPTIDEAYPALVKGFQKALEIQLAEEELTDYEQKLADELRRNKFLTDEWNVNGRAPV